jgi:hypothetical protein
VVEAFLPALQAPTLAAQMFGKINRWGKMPVTLALDVKVIITPPCLFN